MTERSYTLAEIDKMRELIKGIEIFSNDYLNNKVVEDKLRTYLLSGISVSELESKLKKVRDDWYNDPMRLKEEKEFLERCKSNRAKREEKERVVKANSQSWTGYFKGIFLVMKDKDDCWYRQAVELEKGRIPEHSERYKDAKPTKDRSEPLEERPKLLRVLGVH